MSPSAIRPRRTLSMPSEGSRAVTRAAVIAIGTASLPVPAPTSSTVSCPEVRISSSSLVAFFSPWVTVCRQRRLSQAAVDHGSYRAARVSLCRLLSRVRPIDPVDTVSLVLRLYILSASSAWCAQRIYRDRFDAIRSCRAVFSPVRAPGP